MKSVKYVLLALLLNSASALAAPASEASIRELLEVSQTRQMIETIHSQYSNQLDGFVKQALKGKKIGPNEQKALDNMSRKMDGVLQEMLSWETMEPMLMRIYGNALTEEKIRGILDFYRTPAGQALIKKIPQVTQLTMVEMKKMMQDLGPKLQKIAKEFEEEIKAEK